ncbi:MAG: 50S ribosomal protein L11 methyltransferase [Bacteroidota bacterium]
MNDTLVVSIELIPKKPWNEILVAQLSDLGFDAFEETETGIKAYGPESKIAVESLIENTILADKSLDFEFTFEQEIIPFQNWNEKWEADFEAVYVEDKLSILAPFHDKSLAKGIVIEIQPQMSFGTGHHQTTWMMSKAMLDEKEIIGNVLDMGTGTGVLAILAEKLGAESILAIDIEDWSVENTIENAERNKCTKIEALHGDVDLIHGKVFDLILANINKNILKAHLEEYIKSLKIGGKIYLSGFFESDAQEMIAFSENLGLKHLKTLTKETWAQLSFVN